MHVYCDESGGIGAGVMTFAGVALAPEAAASVLQRMVDVIGLRGELKGSRIDLPQRAFFVELLMRHDARVLVCTADMAALRAGSDGRLPEDYQLYARLLHMLVDSWAPEAGACLTLEIDDGRYDARLNGALRADVQASLGQWGKAVLADSRRSAGVQIADVLANSFYQIGLQGPRARRIEALFAPFVESGQVRTLALTLD